MATETIYYELDEHFSGLVGNVWRERTVEYLTVAYGEGYLTADQHSERTALALAARTAPDLRRAVGDLPTDLIRTVPSEFPPWRAAPAGVRACQFLAVALATAFTCVLATGNGGAGNGGALFALGLVAVFFAIVGTALEAAAQD